MLMARLYTAAAAYATRLMIYAADAAADYFAAMLFSLLMPPPSFDAASLRLMPPRRLRHAD